MTWKYIIFEGTTGFDPILFPAYIKHDGMARKFPAWKPISAGFVKIGKDGTINCYGHSESLKLKAGENDALALEHLVA